MFLHWNVEAEILFKVGVSCVFWFLLRQVHCVAKYKFIYLHVCWLIDWLIHSLIHSFIKIAAMLTATFTHPFDILPSSIKNHKFCQLHNKLLHLKGSLFTCFIQYIYIVMEICIAVYQLNLLNYSIHFWGSNWNFIFIFWLIERFVYNCT
jgi:hypothetical protein